MTYPARYCVRCNRRLPLGTTPGHCLSCGWQFDPDRPATYLSRPRTRPWQAWLPAVVAAITAGVASYAFCLRHGPMGFALFMAVPVSAGTILGYSARVRLWVYVILALVTLGGMVVGVLSLQLAGFFCGMTLSAILMVPLALGVLLGWGLRCLLERTGRNNRRYAPLIVFFLLPYGTWGVERQFAPVSDVATVTTSRVFSVTPEQAFQAICFYEEVEHRPPWTLRMALPLPVRSVGDKTQPGELVRCEYDRGYLVKRIDEVTAPERLSFDVVEQHLHFERDVTLLDGSFDIAPAGEGEVRVTLTTRYRRHLRPWWVWQPIETQVVRGLHEHVLEGMRRRAEGSQT